MTTQQAIAPYQEQDGDVGLAMVMTAADAKARLRELQEFVHEVMIEGEDYGTIPGTNKPTLFKPGAEKMLEIYGLAATQDVTNRIEDWDRGFFHYEVRCTLISKRTGAVIAVGLGSCNSKEARYRWRDAQRKCPACGAEAIFQSKPPQDGFYCWKKKGGCGLVFRGDDRAITGQVLGRVENDDIFTLVNTILKMAGKRAKVDATLAATRSSALFTQDLDDIGGADSDDGPRQPPARTDTSKGGEPLATPAQINAIYAVARREFHWSDEDTDAHCRSVFRRTTAELSKLEASELLDRMKTNPASMGLPARGRVVEGTATPAPPAESRWTPAQREKANARAMDLGWSRADLNAAMSAYLPDKASPAQWEPSEIHAFLLYLDAKLDEKEKADRQPANAPEGVA